jgi:phosphoribosylformylglycinamidine synthase
MGVRNPIVSIHDQGAGGNGNVLKEIVEPKGAVYQLRNIPSGDPTLSVMELWGAEYQENNAILVEAARLKEVVALGHRENCAVSPVGVVTTTGRVSRIFTTILTHTLITFLNIFTCYPNTYVIIVWDRW